MKISHKLCIRIDGPQFLWLSWFTAKNHSPQTYQLAVYSSDFGYPLYPSLKILQSKINSRLVAGTMGQMNRRPSVRCSKYFFFRLFIDLGQAKLFISIFVIL